MTPQLRFLEFTEEWQAERFDRLFSFSTGRNIKQGEASPHLKTPCVRYGELYHLYGEVINDVVNRTDLPTSELLFSNGDEILLPSAGEDPMDIGSASALTIKGIAIGRTINILRPKDVNLYDQIFASYYINYVLKKKISQFAKGNSISNVYNSDLKKLTMKLPDLAEQEKIADFLAAIDERIAASERKCELLARYKRGVMQQLFSQEIRFKKPDGSNHPDWQSKKLGDVFNEVTNRVGSTGAETYSITAGKGFVSQTEKFGRDISGSQNALYTLLSENEFAYNKGNSKTYTYGCVYENKEGIQIAVPNVFISFKLKDKCMTSGFFAQLFLNHYLDRHLRKIISSGARMDGLLNVSKRDFFSISVPVPSYEEQQIIADFLTALDARITVERTKLNAAKQFKKALLQRMFV